VDPVWVGVNPADSGRHYYGSLDQGCLTQQSTLALSYSTNTIKEIIS